MHLVTFIVVAVFVLAAILFFSGGLIRLYRKNDERARSLISTGFMIGLLGVVIAVIIFDVFSV